MNSTIKLYKNSKILLGKNFKVDGIEAYLATLTNTTLSNFQYIKHMLTTTIKFDINQTHLDPVQANNYNYISVRNGDETIHYYFVVGKKWLAQETIEYQLVLDTINTFDDNLSLSDKTMINRQHKDRFEAVPTDKYQFVEKEVDTIQLNKLYHISNSPLQPSINLEIRFMIGTNDGMKLTRFDNDGRIQTEINNIQFLTIERTLVGYDLKFILYGSYEEETIVFTGVGMFGLTFFKTAVVVLPALPSDFLDGDIKVKNAYKPLIDFYPEGLNPILYKKKEELLKDKYDDGSLENNSFYLIYRNRNQPTEQAPNPPIDMFLCSDEQMELSTTTGGTIRFNASQLGRTKMGMLLYQDGNQNLELICNALRKTLTAQNEALLIYFNDVYPYDTYIVGKLVYRNGAWEQDGTFRELPSYSMTLKNVSHMRTFDIVGISELPTPTDVVNYPNIISPETLTGQTINSIKEIDKTDPRLVKIIKLPYAPTGFNKDETGKFVFDSSYWNTDDNNYENLITMFKLKDFNLKLVSSPNFALEENPFDCLKTREMEITRQPKNLELETKLFHSDYYQYKAVYDSFSFIFQMEKMTEYIEALKVNFITTLTITSNFMFEFENYKIDNATQDYEKIMPVRRNNEVVLYNSDYINYIKTGFNYDVKAKERSETNAVLSTGGQIVGSIISFGIGVASQNPFMIAQGVSLAVSSFVSIATTANQIAQQEANIQQKLHQANMNSVSVVGSDDVDLMTYYTDGNKAKLCLYEVSERMKKALFDVFYYGGYVANYQGLPNKTSRAYFNFVSADIVFAQVPNLPLEITKDIVAKYKEGITFLHHYNNEWDFEQVLENWETSIL